MRAFVVALVSMSGFSPAHAQPLHLSPEIDPLPFALGGFGTQLGFRHEDVAPVRIAPACFSLDVPSLFAELGGNEGFNIHVRASPAVYVLYLPSRTGRGWAFGGSIRYLRLQITHDDEGSARADVSELSPEAIIGYRWFPTSYGFYAQPWLGASFTLHRSGELAVGSRTYDPLPAQLFFTVNLGWEVAL
jgi:hypothetical protein